MIMSAHKQHFFFRNKRLLINNNFFFSNRYMAVNLFFILTAFHIEANHLSLKQLMLCAIKQR